MGYINLIDLEKILFYLKHDIYLTYNKTKKPES